MTLPRNFLEKKGPARFAGGGGFTYHWEMSAQRRRTTPEVAPDADVRERIRRWSGRRNALQPSGIPTL